MKIVLGLFVFVATCIGILWWTNEENFQQQQLARERVVLTVSLLPTPSAPTASKKAVVTNPGSRREEKIIPSNDPAQKTLPAVPPKSSVPAVPTVPKKQESETDDKPTPHIRRIPNSHVRMA